MLKEAFMKNKVKKVKMELKKKKYSTMNYFKFLNKYIYIYIF